MGAYRISVGSRILRDGQTLKVVRAMADGGLQLESEETFLLHNMRYEDLAADVLRGDVQLRVARPSAGEAAAPIQVDLGALPDNETVEIQRRLGYLKAVKRVERLGGRVADIVEGIADHARKAGDASPPSLATFYRWRRFYQIAGDAPGGLRPATRRRGNTTRRLHPQIQQILSQAINERYLTMERPTIEDTYATVIDRVRAFNDQAAPAYRLSRPSLRTLYREIGRLDRYEVMARRYGTRAADLEFRSIDIGVRTTRPLERVEFDHTKLDFFVVGADGRPVGRPWLTVAIDHYSRMPIGYYLGFKPPSTHTVMLALHQAILPKDWVKERFPSVTGTWPCYGMPETLVVDNGREFHSIHLIKAAQALDMHLQYAAVGAPWYKGVVERHFREVNRSMLGKPGTTFNSPEARGDYDPAKNAAVSRDLLEELLCKWIVDIHGASFHRGIQQSPLDRWHTGVKAAPPCLPRARRELDVLLARVGTRIPTAKGIQYENLFYNCEQLAELRRRLPDRAEVEIRVNPGCLGEIHVLDPDSAEFFPVPALNQAYASGLGLWQHHVIQRLARAKYNGDSHVETLARAKEDIHRMIQEAMSRSRRKTGTAVKAARFMEHGGTIPPAPAAEMVAAMVPPPAAATPADIPLVDLLDDDDGQGWALHYDLAELPYGEGV